MWTPTTRLNLHGLAETVLPAHVEPRPLRGDISGDHLRSRARNPETRRRHPPTAGSTTVRHQRTDRNHLCPVNFEDPHNHSARRGYDTCASSAVVDGAP